MQIEKANVKWAQPDMDHLANVTLEDGSDWSWNPISEVWHPVGEYALLSMHLGIEVSLTNDEMMAVLINDGQTNAVGSIPVDSDYDFDD